jgi:hypothetical protein
MVLNRSPSTVSRELTRNAPPVHTGYYLSHKAQERADKRKHESHRRQRRTVWCAPLTFLHRGAVPLDFSENFAPSPQNCHGAFLSFQCNYFVVKL